MTDDETLLDVIREESPEWDVLGVDVVDETDDGTLFVLVIRRRVGESGNMILSERYFRFNPEERSGTYLSNGIERRVTGSLGAALRVLYAATTNGDVDPESPMLMDSRGDGLDYNPEELVDAISELGSEPEIPVDRRHVDEDDPVSQDEPERKGWVRCKRCGETLPEEDATQFSSGPPLGDVYVHPDRSCVEEEESA